MIDKAKRQSLKVLAVATGSAVTPAMAVAGSRQRGATPVEAAGFEAADFEAAELAQFDVQTRVSALQNDLEIVLKNTGSQPATITHITPASTSVARGEFNFAALLKDGPVTVEPGQTVSVPLTRKAVKLWSAASSGGTTPLSANLRSTMSIVTEGSAFASVRIPAFLSVA